MCDSLYYECVYPVLAAMTATVEPVFLLQWELPLDSGSRFDTLEIFLAAERVSGSETILAGFVQVMKTWKSHGILR